MLEVRGLCINYRIRRESPFQAIDNVTFAVKAGEVVAVVGESGSGKTTLALAIARLLPENATITAGSILFQGHDMRQLPEQELEKIRGAQIAMVSQEPAAALNPFLCIGDHVTEALRAHRNWDKQRRREAAYALLQEVQLHDTQHIYNAYPHELSGGQRQRAAIAQALACRPTLLIADEPTTAVDATTQVQILGLLKQLRTRMGMAMLIITHDPAALVGFADRMMVIHQGQIVENGIFSKVCRRPLHPYTGLLLSSMRPNGSVRYRPE